MYFKSLKYGSSLISDCLYFETTVAQLWSGKGEPEKSISVQKPLSRVTVKYYLYFWFQARFSQQKGDASYVNPDDIEG